MQKGKMNKMNIWTKLAVGSAIINIVTFPVWVALRWLSVIVPNIDEFALTFPYVAFIVTCWLLAFPLVYFSVYCIWHWKVRYIGNHHLAWPILTILTYWPNLLTTIPTSFFVAIIYFFMHIVPDVRKKGKYSQVDQPTATSSSVALPSKYKLIKSTSFVTGWSLIGIAILIAITSCFAHFMIWNTAMGKITNVIGKPFTKEMADGLLAGSEVGKVTVVTILLCSITTAIGALLVHSSHKINRRLLEQ